MIAKNSQKSKVIEVALVKAWGMIIIIIKKSIIVDITLSVRRVQNKNPTLKKINYV